MSANAQAAYLARHAWRGNWTMERAELTRLLATGLDLCEQLHNIDLALACDTAGRLHDAISNKLARLSREADDAGIGCEAATLDMSELDAMIDKLERAYQLQTKKGY